MTGAADEVEAGGIPRPHPLWPAATAVRGVWTALSAEQDRWFLWLPVFLGTGIGIYFSLTFEPPFWLGLALAALTVAAVAFLRWRERGIAAALALAAIAVGFAAAEIETWAVAA